MTFTLTEWRSSVAWPVLLAVMVSLTPLRVLAAEEKPSPKPGPIRASIEKIAVSDSSVRATRTGTAARAQDSRGRDGSFFKSKSGIIALAVLVVGAGYAVYSTQNDRIKSPGKE